MSIPLRHSKALEFLAPFTFLHLLVAHSWPRPDLCSASTCSKAALNLSRKLPSPGSNPQALFSSGNHQTFSIWLVCSTYAILAKGSFRGQNIHLSSLHHLVYSACNGAFCVLLTTVAISASHANTRMLTALHKLGTGKGAGSPEPQSAPRLRSDCEGYVSSVCDASSLAFFFLPSKLQAF